MPITLVEDLTSISVKTESREWDGFPEEKHFSTGRKRNKNWLAHNDKGSLNL